MSVHGYKYLPDVIQNLEEEDMKKKEQWKKLKSVGDSLDGFAKDKLELNLKKNPVLCNFDWTPLTDADKICSIGFYRC